MNHNSQHIKNIKKAMRLIDDSANLGYDGYLRSFQVKRNLLDANQLLKEVVKAMKADSQSGIDEAINEFIKMTGGSENG